MLGAALGGPADVECPHGELGARLPDRLGGHDPDRLAEIDPRAAGEIAPVAGSADAALGLAGQDRTDLHRFDSGLVDGFDDRLVDQRSGRNQHLAVQGIDDVDGGAASEHPLRQRLHHLSALDHGADGKPLLGPAIFLDDRAVLRDIDEAPREIS